MDVIYAPVALFCYNRPNHTQKVIEALSKNKFIENTEIYVYCDGAKNDDVANLEAIKEVREIVSKINFCKKIHITANDKNLGLANSIISGVSHVLKLHDSVIVLEDDLVVSPVFLEYMNQSLLKYKNNHDVISIHAYSFPLHNIKEPYFIKGADCWGWATWRRGWNLFEPDGNKLLNSILEKKLAYSFDFDGSYPYTQMLRDQINGKVNSWAIRWYASAFLQNKLTLYPGKSLVQNIGTDGSGTNFTEKNTDFNTRVNDVLPILPDVIEESSFARKAIINYFNATSRKESMNYGIKILNKLRYVFRKDNN